MKKLIICTLPLILASGFAVSAQAAVSCNQVLVSKKTTLQDYKAKADSSISGLTQTKLTAADGKTIRDGAKNPKHDPNQIVSFFFDHYSDGTLNRGGTMVQGTPTEIIFDNKEAPAYIIFAGQPVRLLEYSAYMGSNSTQVIRGQDYRQHAQGFSTAIGMVKGLKTGLSEIPINQLKEQLVKFTDLNTGVTTLEFQSGVVVKGIIEKYTENNSAKFGTATVISFKEGTCTVTMGSRVLFDPSWGVYDMLIAPLITETNGNASSPYYNPDRG